MSEATSSSVPDIVVSEAPPTTSSTAAASSTTPRRVSKTDGAPSMSGGTIGTPVVPVREESNKSRDMVARNPIIEITAERLFEWQWPEGSGEYFLLQDQISEYLGIKMFKRKYPDFVRRPLDVEERIFLKDHGVVDTLHSEVGLTALKSDDVMELMANEYPEKYSQFVAAIENRQQAEYSSKVSAGYQQPAIEKSKMGEFIKKTIKSVSEYNQLLNADRKEERRQVLDQQTYIMHYPIGLGADNRQLINNVKKGRVKKRRGRHPVALFPGQYQDYYLKYTSEELKYFPINTAIYGPIITDPNKLPPLLTSADESGSDSDSVLSDDASCCSGSKDGRASRSPSKDGDGPSSSKRHRTDDDSDSSSSSSSSSDSEPDLGPPPAPELMKEIGRGLPNAVCKVCKGTRLFNKPKDAEELVHCSDCQNSAHPTCLELTEEMVDVIKSYPWQCSECKACIECGKAHEEDKMMFCDKCDRGYHTFCVGLKELPTGAWVCRLCAQCAQCGATTPDNSLTSSSDEQTSWQHETIKISLNGDTLRRHQLLCQNCYKQRRK